MSDRSSTAGNVRGSMAHRPRRRRKWWRKISEVPSRGRDFLLGPCTTYPDCYNLNQEAPHSWGDRRNTMSRYSGSNYGFRQCPRCKSCSILYSRNHYVCSLCHFCWDCSDVGKTGYRCPKEGHKKQLIAKIKTDGSISLYCPICKASYHPSSKSYNRQYNRSHSRRYGRSLEDSEERAFLCSEEI